MRTTATRSGVLVRLLALRRDDDDGGTATATAAHPLAQIWVDRSPLTARRG